MLAELRHDRKSYISAARQRIQDLEELLLSDLRERDDTVDAGWDAESLRQDFGDASAPSAERGRPGEWPPDGNE